jgi:hypothetical protein
MIQYVYCICMLMALIIPNSGEAMNEVTVTQLGKLGVGTVNKDTYESEGNDPTPVVLWSHSSPSAVLCYSSQANALSGKLTQKIQKISDSHADMGVYPITFKSKIRSEKDERKMDAIEPEYITPADLDGDGRDEMVLVRHLGGIQAYTTQKMLYNHKPSSIKPELYAYAVENVHKAHVGGKDVIFFVINRQPYDDIAQFKADDLNYHNATPNFLIAKIDGSGISDFAISGLEWKIHSVLALGVLNRPGSQAIDEIVICSNRQDSDGIYLSRHHADGTLIDAPRKVYVDMQADGLSFIYVPQSKEMLLYNLSERRLYFVTPDKKANWIRRVDLVGLLGHKDDIDIVNTSLGSSGLIVLVRDGNKIFAIDDESMFYTWKKGAMTPGHKKSALLDIGMESTLHTLVDVAAQESDRLMVVQSRAAQIRELPDKELIESAKHYLSAAPYAECESELGKVQLDDYAKEKASIYCDTKGLRCPELKSLEELKQRLPEVYQGLVDDASQDFLICLRVELLSPLKDGKFDLSSIEHDDSYINKEAYRSWLENIHCPSEMVFSIMDLKGRIIAKHAIAGFSNPDLSSDLWRLHRDRFRSSGEHGHAVMALEKSGPGQPAQISYYSVKW